MTENRMELAKRFLIICLIVLIYFTIWRSVRGFVTQNAVVPQIEYAIANCDETISYQQSRATSLYLFLLDREKNEYETFGYVSPAGFYLLFGLLFIVMMGGSRIFYFFLFGFHFLFWILSTATILPGLCFHRIFLHITFAGVSYFTPFFTFLIIILLISPKLLHKFGLEKEI